MTDHVTAGFLPLLDAVILLVAKERGFAEQEDIDLSLVKETSWANIRDRMAIGHFDAAHMLAPMPIAANLGLSQMPVNLVAPMALGLGGNAITISQELRMQLVLDDTHDVLNAASAGEALKDVIEDRKRTGAEKLRFGIVHPFSGHNMELRYWLAASGIDPETDVSLFVVPPSLMVDALTNGQLDGFCVGEPWNTVAVARGVGTLLTVKSAIWRSSPEKVLAVRKSITEEKLDLVERLIRSLYQSARWCKNPENGKEVSTILSSHLNVNADLLMCGLSGCMRVTNDSEQQVDDFFLPFERAATFPWQSHALWFYSQLVRWAMVDHKSENVQIAQQSFRPDIYRRALAPLNANVPNANLKVEGALTQPTSVGAMNGTLILGPDGFFDSDTFDPGELDAYIENQKMT